MYSIDVASNYQEHKTYFKIICLEVALILAKATRIISSYLRYQVFFGFDINTYIVTCFAIDEISDVT